MYLWDWTLIGVGSISVYYICMQHSQARAWTTMLRIKTKYGYKTTMRFAWSAWYCFVTLPLSVLPHHDHSKNSKEICRSIQRTKIQRRNKLGYGRSRGCRRNSTVALLILGPDVAGELVRSKEHFMVRRMWILSDWMMHCPLFTLQDREHASQLGYLLVKCIYGRNFLMFQFWKVLVDGCNWNVLILGPMFISRFFYINMSRVQILQFGRKCLPEMEGFWSSPTGWVIKWARR